MHSNAAREYAFEVESETPRPSAQVIRLYPATPHNAQTSSDSSSAGERLAVRALITATLALGGTLYFSLAQGLQHYGVF